MSDKTKIINSERIEALEKRVVELEKLVREQPKFNDIINGAIKKINRSIES